MTPAAARSRGGPRDLVAKLAGLHVLVAGDVDARPLHRRQGVPDLSRGAGAGRSLSSAVFTRWAARPTSRTTWRRSARVSPRRHRGRRRGGSRASRQRSAPRTSRATAWSKPPSGRPVEKVRVVTGSEPAGRAGSTTKTTSTRRTDIELKLVDRIERLGGDANVLLVSDYLKGTITSGADGARSSRQDVSGVPLLVDPKIPHLNYYAGATLVTPNHHEAEAATHRRIRSDDEARRAAARISEPARSARRRAHHARRSTGCGSRAAVPEGDSGSRARGRRTSPAPATPSSPTLALAVAAGATLGRSGRSSPITRLESSSGSSDRRRSLRTGALGIAFVCKGGSSDRACRVVPEGPAYIPMYGRRRASSV